MTQANTAQPEKALFSDGSFTPGPLEIHRQHSACTISGFYHVREAGKDRPAVAYVPLREDAALYAAAPDLLAALEAVERARNTDTPKDWERATQLTDAALSKATGGQHV